MPKGKGSKKAKDVGLGGAGAPPQGFLSALGTQDGMQQSDSRASRSESRLSTLEAGLKRMGSILGDIKSSLDVSSRPSRSRQRSPSRLGCSRDSSADSTDNGNLKTPFAQTNFVDKSVKVDSMDTLNLVSLRTLRILLEKGDSLEMALGFLDHAELLCEKAITKVYRPSALIAYDCSVRGRANLEGPRAFASVRNADVLRYFSYDSTVVAQKGSGSSTRKAPGSSRPSGVEKRPCFVFNKAEGSCKTEGCRYVHACMFCKSTAHGASGCSNSAKSK